MIELTVRLVFSLAVVLGLLLLCARLAGRRFQGRRDALVQVVHRQPISRNASVSVVSVGGRVLVLGTTDQEVRLLTELDPDQVEGAAAALPALTLLPTAMAPAAPESGSAPSRVSVAETLRRELEEEPARRPGRHLASRGAPGPRGGHATGQQGALSGSMLSTRTWRQAWGAVTGRAS